MTRGDRIFLMRKRCGYTMQSLANLMCVTNQTIDKWEKGIVTNIPLDKVERLAEIFCCNPAWLVWGDEVSREDKVDDLSRLIQSLPADKQNVIRVLAESLAKRD